MQYYNINNKHIEFINSININNNDSLISEINIISNINKDYLNEINKNCGKINDDILISYKLNIVKNNKKINKLFKKINKIKNYYTKNYNILILDDFCNNNKQEIIKTYIKTNLTNDYYSILKNEKKNMVCEMCESVKIKIISDNIIECNSCGHFLYTNLDKIKESEKNTKVLKYQRLDYFIDYIRKFLVKKMPPGLDDSFFDKLKKNIRKDGITNFSEVTPIMLDKYLKKMKKSSLTYYKSFILMQIANIPAPKISSDDLIWMQEIFREVESSWNEIKSSKDYSFPYYPFFIYKIMELNENYDEYLDYWKLSESTENIKRLNNIWKKICEINNYEYIKTYRS